MRLEVSILNIYSCAKARKASRDIDHMIFFMQKLKKRIFTCTFKEFKCDLYM